MFYQMVERFQKILDMVLCSREILIFHPRGHKQATKVAGGIQPTIHMFWFLEILIYNHKITRAIIMHATKCCGIALFVETRRQGEADFGLEIRLHVESRHCKDHRPPVGLLENHTRTMAAIS
ncbi:unnamed protein product, partial [Ectocarpus sp. 12 AP-2014]